MKAGCEEIRRSRRETSVTELQSIYNGTKTATYDYVKKLRTAIVARRTDFSARIVRECRKIGIKAVCSPFETDWELIEAQKAGMRGIITLL